MVLHLKKLESPSPKDALCQVWLKLAQWFWRRRFYNLVNVFSLFRNYLPLELGGALHLNKLESPSPIRMLCAKFGWNWPSGSGEEDFLISSMYLRYFIIISPWPSGSGEEDENVKSLQTDEQTDRQADGQTDDGWQVIRKAHLSFQFRWANNYQLYLHVLDCVCKTWTIILLNAVVIWLL